MQLTITIAGVLLLAASALASPSPIEERAAPRHYQLHVVSDDSRFNGLCMSTYHTGAGFNDAVLGECSNENYIFYSNGTRIGSNIFGKAGAAGVYTVDEVAYYEFSPVYVNIGYGTKGFTYSSQNGFLLPDIDEQTSSGFIACYWSHFGVAQVFLLSNGRVLQHKAELSNCGEIKLIKSFRS